jgi:cellulose synthase operon protein C
MFKVECPGCKAPYQVDERRVPSGGLKMRCPKCGNAFQVDPPRAGRSTGPSPVFGAASAAKHATVLGVAGPRPPRPVAAPAPPAPEEDPYGEIDLPAIGVRGEPGAALDADLPVLGRPRSPAPRPAFTEPPLEIDLPSPTAPAAEADLDEADLPVLSGGRTPAAARKAPTAPRMAVDAEELDLPVVGQRRAPEQAPMALDDFGELDFPSASEPRRPLAGADLPSPSAGLPSPGGDLPSPGGGLPSLGGGLPSPGGGPPSPGGGLPSRGGALPAVAAGAPDRKPDASDDFGELELPLGGSGPPSGPAARGLVRQSGGGTSFGEVNLDASEGAVGIGHDDDMEFGAIPQERPGAAARPEREPPAIAAAKLHAAASSPPIPAPAPGQVSRKRRGLRIALGVVTVLALAGGALALVPGVGPFGSHFVFDQLKRGDHERLVADTARQARELLAGDTHPNAKRAQEVVESARAGAKRVQALAAYTAYVAFLRELRFGGDSAARARGQVLLQELQQEKSAPYLELARAAEAAAGGQHARARQSLTALAGAADGDIDVAILRGELELRAREPEAALEAWQAAEASEKSARTAYGLARAKSQLGQLAEAQKLGRETLARNPEHVGAKILLAQILWRSTQTEAESTKLLDQVMREPGKGSPEELVSAQTLLGEIHLARSRITHAENAFGEALKINPKAAGALAGLGEALFRAGRYSEALARFEAAVQADADEITAKVGVARTLLALERVEDARDALKKLRETHPKSMEVAHWFGKVSEAQGNRKEAEEAYRAAISHGDKHPDVVQAHIALALLLNQLGRSEEAHKVLAEARAKLPDSPSIHKALGELALLQGRYEGALAEFKLALTLDKDDVGARFKLGMALRKNRSFDEAQKAFDEVAVVDRDYPGLALERGLLYEASGQSEEALKAYESALAKAPSDPDLMLRVGCGKVAAGRPQQAIELLRKVQEKRQSSAETLHCLGRALLVEGTNLVEALKTLERAVEIDPHRAEYWLYVGWAANEAGRTARAATALEKAIELDRGLADAYWQRGVMLVRQGAVKDAVGDLKRALELRPSRFEAHAALADAYRDLGMEGEALAQWQKAVAAMPDNAHWRFRFGTLLVSNRRSGEARENLSKAIEIAHANDQKPKWLAEAHLELARAIGSSKESAKHWKAFLTLGPRDSAYRAEAKRALEQLGQPWSGD